MVLVIAEETGRLGNRLFLFAHFIANALEYGYNVVNPCFDAYARYFVGSTHEVLDNVTLPSRRWAFGLKVSRPIFRRMFKVSFLHQAISADVEFDLNASAYIEAVSGGRYVLAFGWMYRDRSNFRKHADRLREYFCPAEPFYSRVSDIISTIKKQVTLLVGVHIRRGDYRNWRDGKYYLSNEIYAEKMAELLRQLGKDGGEAGFLLCSDEPIEADEFSSFRTFGGSGNFIEDLYCLSQCDYIIGVPSSYSLWASFYGNTPLYHIDDVGHSIALEDFKVCETG
jgi:hypothetical protein